MMNKILIVLVIFSCGLRLFFELNENDLVYGEREFVGCVREVEISEGKVKYALEVSGFKALILLNYRPFPSFDYGDCLAVFGKVARPGIIEKFDYGEYLALRGIYGVVYFPQKVEFVYREKSGFWKVVYEVRKAVINRLNKIFSEPYASFMAGLIVGSRKGISANLIEDFNATGLTHILAISGYNITIIIFLVGRLLSFLPRGRQILASVFLIILFVLLVGGSASVVRAAIMGIISVISLWFGRKYFVLRALFFSGFLMVFISPRILLFDVSFQLSFLATLGIILFADNFEKIFSKVPSVFMIRENLKMTVCAQILTLPILLFNFQQFSLVSFFVNILVLPFVPCAMLFGFSAFILSFLSFNLALIIGFFGYLILKMVILVVSFFADLEFAYVRVEWFRVEFLVGYFIFIFWLRKKIY